LLVPQFLFEQGVRQVIPPLQTTAGLLWASLDAYTCILYPFISGRNGFQAALSAGQWLDFGSALKRIHSLALPPALEARIPVETFSARWRHAVRRYQAQAEHTACGDPVAAEMRARRAEIERIIAQAEELASFLQSVSLDRVLCHADIHAGNLLLGESADLYIVDWDNPILAPKERDLMFIGGGVGGIWNSAAEEALFYRGYGSADINLAGLAYYRYERIVEDIAAFCEQILLTDEGGADREQGLRYFASNFLPGEVLEIANRTGQRLKASGGRGL
jgi:spectinomycin phosphotransferase